MVASLLTSLGASPAALLSPEEWAARDIELRTTAVADAKSSDARLAAALEGRLLKPTREDLIWQAYLRMPEATGMTDLQMVDLAIRKVDAFLSRCPGAVRA